jgi:hypothetical protein
MSQIIALALMALTTASTRNVPASSGSAIHQGRSQSKRRRAARR